MPSIYDSKYKCYHSHVLSLSCIFCPYNIYIYIYIYRERIDENVLPSKSAEKFPPSTNLRHHHPITLHSQLVQNKYPVSPHTTPRIPYRIQKNLITKINPNQEILTQKPQDILFLPNKIFPIARSKKEKT
ncbi:Uncharacterized protein TCM_008896 [Theobroma cacao]|uniref:Uncharacterized protein n=1 Tax=Theobroma cacao TaxID=3641 RepID=A0A061E5J1_THECC|nr:Uncharacterized protein TCM_008896 [Theobroma cacao]